MRSLIALVLLPFGAGLIFDLRPALCAVGAGLLLTLAGRLLGVAAR
jgi:hypothetical protein